MRKACSGLKAPWEETANPTVRNCMSSRGIDTSTCTIEAFRQCGPDPWSGGSEVQEFRNKE